MGEKPISLYLKIEWKERGRRTIESLCRMTGGSASPTSSLTPCSGLWALTWGSEEPSGSYETQAARVSGAGRSQKRGEVAVADAP